MPIRLSTHSRLIHFPSTDGLQLEGRYTPGASDRAVVLCHPHPLHQGSMLTPVIMTAEQAFQEAGWTTLAFNFRGVGGSEGRHGQGRDEVADVEGGLTYLAEQLGDSIGLQAICGFSFGSYVGGVVAARDSRVQAYLGIAPVLNHYDYSFLKTAACRIALIVPAQDEFSDPKKLDALTAALPHPPWLRILDTDHLFRTAWQVLPLACQDAVAWLASAT
jgi:uncharacterized protein